ncbi:MAG TPA: TonB family protein [Thermoanaerobaculia bacterium]|nr:TonB family protein [Thermoanaerobaculia bacterium]
MFEDQLIESKHRKGTGKKPLTFAVSLIIHALVIGTVVAASLWFVEEVPEPPIPVQFYAAAPPPPPPPPPPAAKAAPAKVQPKPTPQVSHEVVAPTVIPDVIPQPLPAPEPVPTQGEGVEGGVEGGVPGGVVGGVIGGTPGGTGTTPGAPLRVGGDVKAPVLKERVEPVYPEPARKARMQGVVILEAIITADGTVSDVKVLKSVNPLLDAAAERAVSKWTYRPATLGGRAVSVYLTVTVNFQLH